jgi:hypothetical protein
MRILTAVNIAILLAGSTQLQAVTVESYQKHRADPTTTEAVFDKLYLDGLGDGMQAANLTGFLNSAKSGNPTLLYCSPPGLALQTDNYMAILDSEIKRSLDLAADDPVKIKAVMRRNIDHLLIEGLIRTFPCTPAKIQEVIQGIIQQEPPAKKKQ